MAIIKPFQAIRPAKEYAEKIAALPYDVYNREEARKIVEQNSLSFLAIDRPETAFDPSQDMYAACVYEKAAAILKEWMEKGYFLKDDKKIYYLYELTWKGRSQCGFVAVASIDDYHNQVILKHENTREEKEQDRIRHISYCNAQTGPIFLAYRDRERLNEIIGMVRMGEAIYDVKYEDQVRHRVFLIEEDTLIQEIEEQFLQIDRIYIADGHHRCASAVKVGTKRREDDAAKNQDAEYNYFLSVLFPQSELEILDYNRVVKDLNGYTTEEFLKALEKNFRIEKKEEAVSPNQKGCFGMYLEGQWYLLTFRLENQKEKNEVKNLDVSILQDYCLEPMLNIQDPRTDHRIDFVGGIRGLEELERRTTLDCKVAFSMYPTTMEELFSVADAGQLMPPKSTWFEPKLRSGFFIHQI